MFVQVIQGHITDADQMHAALDRWERELAPGADGWIDSTAGVTDNDEFIAVVRFETAQAAQRNSDRPEQDRWWRQTSELFTDAPMFQESDDVIADGDHPERAGFVQIIEGRGSDPDRARELMADDSPEWAEFRPDVIGSVACQHEGGKYTMAMYFTSEREAREGEKKEMPPALKEQMAEMDALSVGEPSFYDLHQPWIQTAHHHN